MRKKLTGKQRAALLYLSSVLGRIGSANDAEDHGYCSEALRLRKESVDSIGRLLHDAPFIAGLFPRLEGQLRDESLFIMDWALIQREIDALLALPAEGMAGDEKGK